MLALELQSGDIFQLEFVFWSKDQNKYDAKFESKTKYLFLSRTASSGDRFSGTYLDGTNIKTVTFFNALPVTKVVGC